MRCILSGQRPATHYVWWVCEIVTGPVARFARQIAGQGYIVAAPSSYHDFTGPEPLAYDVPGTDKGNEWKITKVGKLQAFSLRNLSTNQCIQTLNSYDEDSTRSVDYLLSLPTCTGRIGATGMCLGGHLALRASVCLPFPSPPTPLPSTPIAP